MANKQDAREDRIRITLPKDPLNEEDEVAIVMINGKPTQIKRGEEVLVSRDVYLVLKQGKRI
jgi:hypothetical protein